MSVFEDKIRRNKSHFNQKEPGTGHKDRFLSKLEEADLGKNQNFHFSQAYKVAAVFILIATVGFILIYIVNENPNSNEALVNSIEYSQDLNDILAYYDAVSLEKIGQIDKLVNDSEQAYAIKESARQRLEDIDGSIASIEKELVKNPEDENIKSTIINIKRKKVKVMDDMLTQLDFANSSLF